MAYFGPQPVDIPEVTITITGHDGSSIKTIITPGNGVKNHPFWNQSDNPRSDTDNPLSRKSTKCNISSDQGGGYNIGPCCFGFKRREDTAGRNQPLKSHIGCQQGDKFRKMEPTICLFNPSSLARRPLRTKMLCPTCAGAVTKRGPGLVLIV